MISLIVPIFNSEKTLERCVNSIRKQSYKNLEILLIDDGSTDKSQKICKELEKLDNRIRVISQENKGVSIARNRGIKEAKGNYLQFVDSDDHVEELMCEKLINTMLKYSSDLIIYGYRSITKYRTIEVRYPKIDYVSSTTIQNNFEEFYKKGFFTSVCNKLYKKSLIKQNFDNALSLGEDLVFNLNYFKNIGNTSLIEDVLYNYMDEFASSLSKKLHKNEFYMIKIKYDKLKNYNIDQKNIFFINKIFELDIDTLIKKRILLNEIEFTEFVQIIENKNDILKKKKLKKKNLFFLWLELRIKVYKIKVRNMLKKIVERYFL